MSRINTLVTSVVVCLMIIVSFAILVTPSSGGAAMGLAQVADTDWVKQGVVLDGSSFPLGVQYTSVLFDEGIYKMWYAGLYGATNGEIFYATSPDGYNWTEQGCAVPKPTGVNYAVAPSVLKEDDGTYKMWFSCQDYSWKARTYLATSNDGINWVYQGVAINIGAPGSPDSQYAVQASVFKDDGLYKAYYKTYDDYSDTYFMYATSTDGYSWTKHGVVMDVVPGYDNFQCPFVMKNDNGTYTMLYDSSQSGSCRIYKAFSTDGITWQQQGLELDIGASGSLDEPMIFAPHVLKDTNTGTDMLYYSGYDGADRRIFLATRQQATDPVEPAEVDLAVYDNDISFSNANPDEGTTVTIEAIIHGDQSQEGQWIKSGVILDIGGAGEDLHVVAPCVLKMDDGSYVMWYTGDGDDNLVYRQRIFRATSPDGISWTRQGLALDYGNAYEQNGVLNPYVMIDDLGVYHMWYTGIGYNSGYRAYIHKAVSYDCGMSWQKMGLDLNYGSAADPDGAASSHVLYDGSQWRMWYQGIEWGSPNEGRVCHAHKAQLSDAWIKDGVVLNNDGPYDYPGVSNPRVIPNDNGYDMYYTGYDPYTGPSRILHAHSPDGLTWTKTGIILEGSLPLESNKVGLGQITFEGDTMKAWYCGHDGANWRTFYAEKPVAKAGQDATCTVSIYLDSISEANLIGRQTNVMIPADGNTIVLFDWTAVPGDHEMIAEITDSDPLDMDNTNDMAVVQITVEALPEPTEVVDIYIDDPDISISDSSPDEGEMVDIEAAIHNAALDNDALVDWKVCGEFHLTYRSHPDGCEVARPIFIGDNNNNIGVWAYGGNSVINNKRDTISLRAFGETFAVHYSSSGGSGYYDDGYYVEFWYQSSDNRFYAKLCDAADHSIIYTSGDIEAVDFSFDALSIGSNLGTEGIGWDGIPLIYEGWVDDVEFHWSEDGISGYENSLYYDFSASDGFVKVDDQIHSGVYIDSTDENVFFHADRLDTIDSGERLENSLPTALTNVAAPSYADAVCTVSFYLDSIAEENLIDRQYDVLVPGGGDTMVSTSWLADVAGDYTIIVDVHDVIPGDIDLSNNVASSQITVTEPYVPPPPLPPVAEAGPDQAIDMGVAIILDGSGSYDPDGTIVSYDWDFGDGTTGTGINALITYAAVGNYTIELTVTDNDGLSATDTCQIIVVEPYIPPPPLPPVAETGPDQTTDIGVAIILDGSGSYDPDGTIVSYDWDFGDGNTGTGICVSHAYSLPGTYTVILTVIDNDGLSATDTCQIIVSEPYIPPPPLPPIADAGADQITDVDIELIFDGSGSYDPDGTIISYDWDFGDGAIGTGVNALHTYTTAGNYMVILTVTDDDGLSATDTCQITVTEPYVPDPIGAELAIDKIKIAGPDVVETHTKYGWTLRITVSNIGDSDAQDVVMHDVLPAELELVAFTKSTGTFTFKQNGGGQMGSTALTWEIGTMVSGQSETLDIVISTRLNPAGKQEFTSPGTYSLNDGAWVTGFDAITGEGLLAGPTPNITVVAVDGEDAEVEEENISPIEADSIYPDAIIHIIAENDIPDMDADEVESSVSASKKAATSYFSLFILALVGMIISVLMAAHIIDGKKEDDKTGKKEVNDQDEMLIKGEITEEEYVRKLKDMK